MFERFTDSAHDSFVVAQHMSVHLGRDQIGPDALLAGSAAQQDGVAGRALAEYGADYLALRHALGLGDSQCDSAHAQHLPFSKSARAAIKGSLHEASATDSEHISTGHLAAATLAHPSGEVTALLVAVGVTPAALRASIFAILSEGPGALRPEGPNPFVTDGEAQPFRRAAAWGARRLTRRPPRFH